MDGVQPAGAAGDGGTGRAAGEPVRTAAVAGLPERGEDGVLAGEFACRGPQPRAAAPSASARRKASVRASSPTGTTGSPRRSLSAASLSSHS
ncbi:hypothetical protein H0E86_23420 [Streptomyces sp. SCSIO-PteL053]|nr:hypothetical protein H0E86_23420 [Streptomyces sp. SCSIO-PteL053]